MSPFLLVRQLPVNRFTKTRNTMQTISIDTLSHNQVIHIENQFAKASISLVGAHVFSFIPKQDNKERLWLSPLANLEGNEAIRGGTPVCWPWFSNQFPDNSADLPAHGFARTSQWTIAHINSLASGETEIQLQFSCNHQPGFPYSATLVYNIVIGNKLTMSLTTHNTDTQTFTVTSALHTYFRVDNLNDVILTGLTGPYRDKTKNFETFETPAHYNFDGEVDRIHETQINQVTIKDKDAHTVTDNAGHDSLVVWNPGATLVTTINNIPDESIQHFVCVEAAITSPLSIAPGQSHTLTQSIS